MTDEFLFADDDAAPATEEGREPYHILIIDDDQEIHAITKMALNEFKLDGHPVRFTSGYSGAEARELLSQPNEYAMVLLDVVMENDHAGLDTARWIRETLKNHLIRIVLRTGQPGQAPEEEVIAKYDIDDYKEKTELTYRKLVTLMYSCLRAYRDLCAIERNKKGLEKVITASAEVFSARSLQQLCQGILEQIVALITRSDDAAYVRMTGFTAIGSQRDPFEIISGTGDYADNVGSRINGDVDQAVLAKLRQSTGPASILSDGNYYGIYTTSRGNQYLLFVRNIRELTELDQNLLNLFINHSSIALENHSQNNAELEAQRDLLYSVGEAIDKHSIEAHSHHVKRSAEMAAQLAILSGCSREEADRFKAAAAVYDIGKITLQRELAATTDVLTVHQYEEIMRQVINGHDYFSQADSALAVIAARLAHDFHERWDGSGYPHGKRGVEIDHGARLLSLTSHLDSLLSARGERPAKSEDEAKAYIKENSGIIFEPELVSLLLDHYASIEQIRARFPD